MSRRESSNRSHIYDCYWKAIRGQFETFHGSTPFKWIFTQVMDLTADEIHRKRKSQSNFNDIRFIFRKYKKKGREKKFIEIIFFFQKARQQKRSLLHHDWLPNFTWGVLGGRQCRIVWLFPFTTHVLEKVSEISDSCCESSDGVSPSNVIRARCCRSLKNEDNINKWWNRKTSCRKAKLEIGNLQFQFSRYGMAFVELVVRKRRVGASCHSPGKRKRSDIDPRTAIAQ